MEDFSETLRALMTEYVQRRAVKEDLEEKFNEAKNALANAEAKLWEAMEALNLSSVRDPNGIFARAEKIKGIITDKEQALQAFEDLGLKEEFYELTPRQSRLTAFVKEALDSGTPLPPGVDFKTTRYISYHRRKE